MRRNFVDVIKLLPAGVTDSAAHQAVRLIDRLYVIERKIKGLDHRRRRRIRKKASAPIVQAFREWLEKQAPVPKSPLGKAIAYAQSQWEAINRFLEDGRLAIDNNVAERDIRALAIGRKNWLFADSVAGMEANAIMYSLAQTAKANGWDPFDYFHYIFATMPLLSTAAGVECLFPWNAPNPRAAKAGAAQSKDEDGVVTPPPGMRAGELAPKSGQRLH